MKPTLKELQDKMQDLKDENERRNLAISLNICPECGAPLIREDIEMYKVPKPFFFGLFKEYSCSWDYRKVCSVDASHYEYKFDAII